MIWKDVVRYDETSPTGLVLSCDRHKGKAGEVAGYLEPDGYYRVKSKGTRCLAHRVVWELHNGQIPDGMFIDHINGIKTDNTIDNLRLTTYTGNARNTGRRSTNTSGITGVTFCDKGNGHARVWWHEDGKNKSKSFSFGKLGKELAVANACAFRDEKIRNLGGYTERHGR